MYFIPSEFLNANNFLLSLSDIEKVKKYAMDELSSHSIDMILDWQIAELWIVKSRVSKVI